jgi:hypothetical protein
MNASAASLTVIAVGARSSPRLAAPRLSSRHAFAAACVGKFWRNFFPSRLL